MSMTLGLALAGIAATELPRLIDCRSAATPIVLRSPQTAEAQRKPRQRPRSALRPCVILASA